MEIIKHKGDSEMKKVEIAPEGSAEWAWQMMLLDNMVIPVVDAQTPWKLNGNRTETELSSASHTHDNWIKVASDRVWQIYTEPKYKVGDWVEVEETNYGSITMHRALITGMNILSDGTYNINFFKWYSMVFCQKLTHRMYDLNNPDTKIKYRITHKLHPSEVRMKITLEGTVEKNDFNGETWFCLRYGDGVIQTSRIDFDHLDTPTREIVENLLKAQESENA